MLFGGARIPENMQGYPGAENFTMTVEGFEDVRASLFTLFRMTLVDEYPYGVGTFYDCMTHIWFCKEAYVLISFWGNTNMYFCFSLLDTETFKLLRFTLIEDKDTVNPLI